jgi:hypothetical protein
MCETIAQAVADFRLAAEALQGAIRTLSASRAEAGIWSPGHVAVYQVAPAWDRFLGAKLRLRRLRPFSRNAVVRRRGSTEPVTVRIAKVNRAGDGWYLRTVRANGEVGSCGPHELFELAIGQPDLGVCTWTHAQLCEATYDTLPADVMEYAKALDRAEASVEPARAA